MNLSDNLGITRLACFWPDCGAFSAAHCEAAGCSRRSRQIRDDIASGEVWPDAEATQWPDPDNL